MIGSCNCPTTVVRFQPTVRLHRPGFADKLEQNTAVYAPITFEEIVIVMINLLYLMVLLCILHIHFNVIAIL